MINDDNKKGVPPKQGYHAKTQKHASRIHYTVTPIADLGAWKREQALLNADRKTRMAETRAHAIKLLQDTAEGMRLRRVALIVQNLANAGMTLDQIAADAPMREAVAKQLDKEGRFVFTAAPVIQTKKSLLDRLKAWFS